MFKPVAQTPDFPALEKERLSHWYKEGIVDKYLTKNVKSEKRFSFLDGPITANNPMGVHHGWGRTYKDLWQRYYNMKGYKQRFQNGFDCQGLWIEVEVEKELGIKNKKDIENLVPGDKKASIAKFVELCKERVKKFSAIQTEQSKRLGYFMNWDNSYFTMSDENNYMIWHFLKTCHLKGWIYKGRDSVPWCPRCETAISQHEMLTEDYKELTHESVIMKFPLVGKDKEYLLVWTTTPWTIPANIAVAVDVSFDYCLVESEGKKYWIVAALVDSVFANKEKKIVKTVKGKALAGMKYRGAFDDLPAVKKAGAESVLFHTVVATDVQIMPISTTEGTGMVHTAVSAGQEDYKLGKKLGLPMIPVIADNADYLPGLGEFTGKNAKNDPWIILGFLKIKEKEEGNWLFSIFKYKHRYPACWRCKAELVWKVAEEWYIAMDIPEKNTTGKSLTLREQMIEVAKKINWIPEFGMERELDWLSNMSDWLISKKNRYWGLALPIYECVSCGWFNLIGGFDELKNKAVNGWDDFKGHSPHKPLIDSVTVKCDRCNKEISRIPDVGNVWLDAGIVPYSTYISPDSKSLSYTGDKKYWQEWFPADFITESFPGQFKNWFYSMIAVSTVLEKENPFKTVLGYASMLGEDGRPMHKSWGNAIEFNEAADKIGVDVMRWIYVTQKETANLLFGYKKADETRRKFHLLLWNIYKFFVTYANLDGWKKDKNVQKNIEKGEFGVLDRWILSLLNGTLKTVTESLDNYDAYTAGTAIEKFVSDLSTWYIRRSRDRIGPTAIDEADKQNFYTVCYFVLVELVKILAPFNPFISEEIFTNLTDEDSVHLNKWPQFSGKTINHTLEKEMSVVRMITETGHAFRKSAGIKVRQPLSELTFSGITQLDENLFTLIKEELNVKRVSQIGDDTKELKVILDTKLTQELKDEGEAREIVRSIQIKRKEMGCRLDDLVIVVLPHFPDDYINYIKNQTLAKTIVKGDIFTVTKS